MIVDFMLLRYLGDWRGKEWYCAATKYIPIIPAVQTNVIINGENHNVVRVELDIDVPKYIVYLS